MGKHNVEVVLPRPHPLQKEFIDSPAKRKVIRAGRRSGKTIGMSILAVNAFLSGARVLYATPTEEQIQTFFFAVKKYLRSAIEAKIFVKNEVFHTIELAGTKQRIRAKTAYNADTLRGDYCNVLILDEFQLMNEETWGVVGAPMLLDNDGTAVFVYTPPSLTSRTRSRARDPRHAAKMFQRAKADTSGRWESFSFTSFDNPYISKVALGDITQDMTNLAYRQEILAEDVEEIPGALWTRELIDRSRALLIHEVRTRAMGSHKKPIKTDKPLKNRLKSGELVAGGAPMSSTGRRITIEDLQRIVVGVDPPGGVITECGIVVAGKGYDGHGYVLDDRSIAGTPGAWAAEVMGAYATWDADIIVGESNFGGEMVEATINAAAMEMNHVYRYKNVHASRGKAARAQPIVAMYEKKMIHHAGGFPGLEDEMISWVPGESRLSPNRVDSLVWSLTELFGTETPPVLRPGGH